MVVLKHIAVNLVAIVLMFALMIPPGLAEGKLGHGSFLAIAFILSAVMTVTSSLAYGVGTKATVVVRVAGAVIVLWFLFSMTMFVVFEKPTLIQDADRHWFGALACVVLIALQGFYNKSHFGAMIGLCDLD